jgi:hypothetical protein
MFRMYKFVVAALAVAAVLTGPGSARADLFIRVSSFTAGGTLLDQQTDSVVLSNPMPAASNQSHTFVLNGGFILGIGTSNFSTVATGSTSHSETMNLTYFGTTGAGLSSRLIVEFLGTNYGTPVSPPNASITSNGSPSTAGLSANSVTMQSGVSVANALLPGTAGSTAGLLGLTSSTGSMGSASSVLTPNPVTGAGFNQSGSRFSFYQAYTFTDFTTTGAGSLSAGTSINVSAVPAPAGLILALTGLPAVAWIRRRKAVVNA